MSIYKGWKPENAYRPEERPNARASTSDATPAPVHLRKAQPVQVLLPKTVAWLDSLPEHVRPAALGNQFARIANTLAAAWHKPVECRHCFDQLLIDRRGARKGFPPDVLSELVQLRTFHSTLYPTVDLAWQTPKDRTKR